MKPYITLFRALVLCFCTFDTAVASLYAGPYEALAFYHAYLAEWEGTPDHRGPTTTIAPGCFTFYPSSPNVRKPCTFDEFFNEAYQRKPGYAHPDVGGLTIDEAARRIFDGGFNNAMYNKEKLVNGLTVRDKHEKVIEKIFGVVQQARRRGVGGDFIDKVLDAVKKAALERSHDQWRGMARDRRATWRREYGIDLVFMDGVSPLGRPSQRPDFVRALRTLRNRMDDDAYKKTLQKLEDEQKNYLSDPTTPGGKHKAPLQALNRARKMLEKPPC